jgi:hypothetical protein
MFGARWKFAARWIHLPPLSNGEGACASILTAKEPNQPAYNQRFESCSEKTFKKEHKMD